VMLGRSEAEGGTQEEWAQYCKERKWTNHEFKWIRVYYCCNCGCDYVYENQENWPFCRYCKEQE